MLPASSAMSATRRIARSRISSGYFFGAGMTPPFRGFGVSINPGAIQADVRGDGVAGPGDGDVGEQQPGDALAFAGWGGGVVPDAGQVGDELADPGFLFLGELPGMLLACLV